MPPAAAASITGDHIDDTLTISNAAGIGFSDGETVDAPLQIKKERPRIRADLCMRQIRDSLRLSLGAVQKVISRADELGLNWDTIEKLSS